MNNAFPNLTDDYIKPLINKMIELVKAEKIKFAIATGDGIQNT